MTVSTALSAGDLTSLRAGKDTVKRYLAFMPLELVATARINQASFGNPLAGFVTDTESAGWLNGKRGMTAWVGTTSGAQDIGVFRLRHDNDTNVCFLGEMSLGDPGLLSLSTLRQFTDNAYVSIYSYRAAWSAFPKIVYAGGVDARSGTFHKDNDDSYGTENETTPAFALNIGPHNGDVIDPTTSVITESRTAEVFAWLAGTTVSSYLWNVGDGTITVGTTTTQSITVTYPAGFRTISCTVTLSTGVSRTAYRHVWAHNPASPTSVYDVQILSDRRDTTGRVMRFREIESLAELYSGQMVMYFEDASWNGSDISSASKQCAGWIREVSASRDPEVWQREFEVVSAMHMLGELKAFAQQLVVTSDPANWQEVIAGLSHIDYWIFYLLNYHTTLLDLFDYELSGLTTLLTKAWQVGTGSWGQTLQQAGARVNANVGQRSDGTIFVRRNPQLMSQADRDAVIERMTLTEADVAAFPAISRRLRPVMGKVKASAFAYDGSALTPYLAVAPGQTSGQAASESSLDDQLVTSSGGQTELNVRVANEFARLNNPYPSFSLPLPLNYDVFEPAERYWTRLTVSADYWPEDFAFDKRCLVHAVTVNHEADSKSLVLELEAETSGINAPALTVPVILPDISQNSGFVSGNSFFPKFTSDPITGLPVLNYNPFTMPSYASPPAPLPDPAYMVAVADGDVYLSDDYGQASPTWTKIFDPGTGWSIGGIAHDPESDIDANDLRLFAIAYNSGTQTGRIYYCADVLFGGEWQLKQTLASGYLPAAIRAVAGVSGGACFKMIPTGAGAHNLLFSDDYFDTYSTTQLVASGGSGGGQTDVDDFNLGVMMSAVSGDVYYTTAYDDASATLLSGVTASLTSGDTTDLRIPFMKTDGVTLNNIKTSLQFLISVRADVSGATTWVVTFNANTGAIISQVDITPIISGTTYRNDIGTNALSSAGGDSQIIGMLAEPLAGGNTDLIVSENGGSTWVVRQANVAYTFLFWPDGTSSILAVCGSGAAGISTDKGVSILDQLGSLPGVVSFFLVFP